VSTNYDTPKGMYFEPCHRADVLGDRRDESKNGTRWGDRLQFVGQSRDEHWRARWKPPTSRYLGNSPERDHLRE